MKFTKEALCRMPFDDIIEREDALDDENDTGKSDEDGIENDGVIVCEEEEDCCYVCGNALENLKIGYNEKEQLYKYECANCNAVYVRPVPENQDGVVFLQGEERNWPEYLMNTLTFPFIAEIIESNDREFFDPNYDGPCLYNTVKVLEVFYSMKYGVEAIVRKGRKKYRQILCFMEAADCTTRNYDELENYKRWRNKYWRSDFLMAFIEALKDNKKSTE